MRKIAAFALSTLALAAACGDSPGGLVESTPPTEAPRLAMVAPTLESGNPTCSELIPGSR